MIDERDMKDFRTTFSIVSHKKRGNFVKVLSTENRAIQERELEKSKGSLNKNPNFVLPKTIYESSTFDRRVNLKQRYQSLLNRKDNY